MVDCAAGIISVVILSLYISGLGKVAFMGRSLSVSAPAGKARFSGAGGLFLKMDRLQGFRNQRVNQLAMGRDSCYTENVIKP
jgi:hypothetical protein